MRLQTRLVEGRNGTYRFNMLPTAARPPHDDADRPAPDEAVDRPGRATRRRMLVRTTGLVIGGGLAIAGGYAWTHGPGEALSYAARRLRTLRDDPMGAETILGISAVFTKSRELPTWFQRKYGGISLRRWLYDASRTPAELTSLFIDYTENHGWIKDPGPSTPESWIVLHGGTEPTDGTILNVAPIIRHHDKDPLGDSVVVGPQHI